ncbi:Dihydrolipoyllysine-residue acetyltransferase component of pyruvate dehydrogenase complex [Gemmata obscuriglobus]|uniref:Dihydrolipoamide acetyltransferase component of pyruvate dehydrogenase complex n=1 Tax=Gemmata obscuriglobus TaxID=114 RepID=A0A2Z3GXA4_9BACT|nr:2-oxo acid dehydrogenase subunit E2 [Gemmata obscuriglobus]AWM37281.1 pyruvate dehydrogenase [Gemmata obscuriglobus]QEG29972.1 Dihydrolipoyllysine-residue acetyltransferase component of pyruvate dehydrogenase complex [Gemmata obscuriglobus]VTS09291.1 dihydrolipoamide acetyltransferase : Pyruvate dehydrogenase E2 component OS=Melioribacter roseus (strain JCM 17771 / P3M-2) GN=MROS_0858 PE=3 SV=1: Biotin_lipoyl: Biotin_lipoyl: E3_binding: 2-oxoacid_dh [Gemmata obscuriglobus UQM 2246]
MDFHLPNLGEGIEGGTITSVLVKPGDTVTTGQPVMSVETDKASMEVNAESDGTVDAVLVKPGDKVSIGAPLLKLGGGQKAEPKAEAKPAAKAAAEAKPEPPPKAAPAPAPSSGAATAFALPALGEGIEGGTITAVFVKAGDAVKAGQNVVAIETDKAAMEVAAEADGTVEAVHVKPGDKVSIGGPLLTLNGGAAPQPQPKASAPTPQPPATKQPATEQAKPQPQPTHAASANGSNGATKAIIPAGPATRKLARELGVALAEVKGTARGGRVTLDDLKGFVKGERTRAKESGSAGGALAADAVVVNKYALPPLPDFSKYGAVEVADVATIRQTIAKNLTAGWRTMPMVTQHELADITDLEAGRKRFVDQLPKGASKITMTVLAIKACVAALKEFPRFNSSYDMNAGKLILKKYFHIGIAVDTERGLVVPVIRDADKKSIRDLAAEVSALAVKARDNKLSIDEMRGGTFTITNLGGIGGTAFTPIVNYPEVAILGLSKSAMQPIVKDGQIVARLMMPLSLTYDHRVIDGADGCRFTVRLAQLFSDPLRLLMET